MKVPNPALDAILSKGLALAKLAIHTNDVPKHLEGQNNFFIDSSGNKYENPFMTPTKRKAALDKRMKADMALFKPGERKRNMDRSDDKKNVKNPNPG